MKRRQRAVAGLTAACLLFVACECSAQMSNLSERYVKLVLAVGVHDADYVDAYYGPPEWREAAAAARRSLGELRSDALELESALAARLPPREAEELVRLRHAYLSR